MEDKIPYLVTIEGYVEHDSTGGHSFSRSELYFGANDEDVLLQVRLHVASQMAMVKARTWPAYFYSKIEIQRVEIKEKVPAELSYFLREQ